MEKARGGNGIGGRNAALDIFRGVAIAIMLLVDAVPDMQTAPPWLAHSPWQGITLADTAFPAFVFAMGGAAAYSLARRPGDGWRGRILRRTAWLFAIGVAFNALPLLFAWLLRPDYGAGRLFGEVLAQGRLFGVLQRLALTYALGMALALWLKREGRLWVAAFFLLAVSSLGYHAYASDAPFAPEANISQAVDLFFPGAAHVYAHYGMPFDPEGLYGTLASTASMLFGLLAGRQFLRPLPWRQRRGRLAVMGAALLACGFLWSGADIVSKPLWTPPYALLNAGGDALVLALLSGLLALCPRAALPFRPFLAFGCNPLFFFLASNAALLFLFTLPAPMPGISSYQWLWQLMAGRMDGHPASAAAFALLWCALWWPLAEFLRRRGIVIRL